MRRSRSCTVTDPRGPRTGSTSTPIAEATASATSAASVTVSSSTHQTPSGHCSAWSAATCAASRVLPEPPAPVSVTNRSPRSRSRTAMRSASLPTNRELDRQVVADRSSDRSGPVRRPGSVAARGRVGDDRSPRRCRPRSTRDDPVGSWSATTEAVAVDTSVWPPLAISTSRSPVRTAAPMYRPSSRTRAWPVCSAIRSRRPRACSSVPSRTAARSAMTAVTASSPTQSTRSRRRPTTVPTPGHHGRRPWRHHRGAGPGTAASRSRDRRLVDVGDQEGHVPAGKLDARLSRRGEPVPAD